MSDRIIKVGQEREPLGRKPKKPKGKGSHGNDPNEKKRKSANRFAVFNEFVDIELGKLTRSQMAVWIVLYRNVRDGSVRQSAGDIARVTQSSRRQVVRAINYLCDVGLLTVIYKGGLNKGPSRYRVNGGSTGDTGVTS